MHEQGHEVYGIDNRIGNSKNGYCVNYLDDFTQIDFYHDLSTFDAIFHLAASADVSDSVKYPAQYYWNNTGKTAELLKSLQEANWKGSIIFSSTAAVYQQVNHPVSENSVCISPNPYGRSKYACEQLLDDYSAATGNNVVKFRYFNVAGAYGECGDHTTSDHIIQKISRSVEKQLPFFLYGTTRSTRDGTCVRDYVHVIDIARAHIQALEYLQDKTRTSIAFNLGSGTGYTNREIVNAFQRFTGKKVHVVDSPDRPGDPDFLVADPSKFIKETGFKYEYNNLERIITSAYNHFTLNNME